MNPQILKEEFEEKFPDGLGVEGDSYDQDENNIGCTIDKTEEVFSWFLSKLETAQREAREGVIDEMEGFDCKDCPLGVCCSSCYNGAVHDYAEKLRSKFQDSNQ